MVEVGFHIGCHLVTTGGGGLIGDGDDDDSMRGCGERVW